MPTAEFTVQDEATIRAMFDRRGSFVASAFGSLRPPETSSPARFLLGVLITKVGTAVAFVIIFSASRNVWGSQWLVYALVWFLMFALSEVGEAVAGRTSPIEAVLGVASEAIYAPMAAFVTQWWLGRGAV